MDIIKKYNIFLENLKTEDNSELVYVIKTGFNKIYESLSTDDANAKRLGEPWFFNSAPSKCVSTNPDFDNEYFKQTLPDKVMEIVNKSKVGNRVWIRPSAGKGVVHHDPLNSGHSYQNANVTGVEWAGDSGGYNLGGPGGGNSHGY